MGLPPLALGIHLLTALAVAVGLSGLNVGLGAYLPNFRETDPSKIVVGFGGTVNMVVGLMFLVCVVGLMAVPLHVSQLASRGSGAAVSGWVYAGVPVGVAVGVVAVVVPLRAGARALRGMEF